MIRDHIKEAHHSYYKRTKELLQGQDTRVGNQGNKNHLSLILIKILKI